MVLVVKNPAASAGDIGDLHPILGSGRPSGGGMATHSSVLAWRIPWAEEPGGLQSMGLQRVTRTAEYFASVACLSAVYSPFVRAWMNMFLEQKEVTW